MMATGGLLLTLNAGPIAGSWGIAAGALALAASLNAVANGAQPGVLGLGVGRTGREAAMVVAFMLQASCLLLVTTVGRVSGTWFTVTLVLTFFTWGEIYRCSPRSSPTTSAPVTPRRTTACCTPRRAWRLSRRLGRRA